MKNEGLLDRILRLILGIGSFFIGFYYFDNSWQYLFYVIGLVLLVTAITGYCGIYKLFGISTVKKKIRGSKKFIPEKKETEM